MRAKSSTTPQMELDAIDAIMRILYNWHLLIQLEYIIVWGLGFREIYNWVLKWDC